MFGRFQIPSVWREMDQLQREMNRFMQTSLGVSPFQTKSFPAINIWTNEDGQVITAELPGIDVKNINIDVTADTLTITGERKANDLDENIRYHRQERDYGEFSRTIQLPFMVDTNNVNAKLNNGILKITLQRAEADKPKKIQITGN